ncbi:MAG: hypothetical protein HXY39_01010 [Chloroflexi bacterium]|nr:hypothetical protein [Chloroflexota bacterium]
MRFKPVYRIVIGASEIDVTRDVTASAVVSLDIERALDLAVDSCELVLAPLGGVQPAPGDDISVDLGYDTTLHRVFTGSIASVALEATAVRVMALSPVRALTARRLGRAYTGRSAGQIVRDLAGEANVRTGVIDDGIRFPVYAVDERVSLARNIMRLAERCGFDAYVLPTGELEFRRFTGAVIHVFTYGKDILDYRVSVRPERASTVTVFGESAASARGDAAASWLTRNFGSGTASGGAGDEPILILDPAIRTTEGATQRAEAALRRSRQRARIGWLQALGRPEIALGDALRIEQAPDSRLNDTFQARAIRHRLTRRRGLLTDIDIWGMP